MALQLNARKCRDVKTKRTHLSRRLAGERCRRGGVGERRRRRGLGDERRRGESERRGERRRRGGVGERRL